MPPRSPMNPTLAFKPALFSRPDESPRRNRDAHLFENKTKRPGELFTL